VRGVFAVGAVIVALLFASCTSSANFPQPLTISTRDINGGKLAPALTCDGGGRSPALSWSTPHPATLSVVVELIDSDAPTGSQIQWVAYGDGPSPGNGTMPSPPGPAFQEGANYSGKTGYQAPCPPHGTTHHYRLTVLAIDFPLGPGAGGGELPSAYTPAQMEAAINSRHGIGVVNVGEIDATYTRP
jgi:phosphatidylethanolamine-binding protein (PEBP) family uncharacterized protein